MRVVMFMGLASSNFVLLGVGCVEMFSDLEVVEMLVLSSWHVRNVMIDMVNSRIPSTVVFCRLEQFMMCMQTRAVMALNPLLTIMGAVQLEMECMNASRRYMQAVGCMSGMTTLENMWCTGVFRLRVVRTEVSLMCLSMSANRTMPTVVKNSVRTSMMFR